MSINTILSTATSGMMAAQMGLRTVSDNVANANTPGYVRKVVDQSSNVSNGMGSGVNINGVRRVVDRYLESATLTAGSAAGRANVLSELLDRSQSLFGDPSGANSFFSGLDEAFSQFAALANDPSSSLQRSQSLVALKGLFDDAGRITESLTGMRTEADTRINANVNRVNDLLGQIAQLNGDVRRARIGGGDSSGSENIQFQLVSELSKLIDVQSTESSAGGIVLRTSSGLLLADETAGTLAYNRSDNAAGFLTVTPANGGGQAFDATFSSGEIPGLLEARNVEIPGQLAQLAEFMSGAARELNRAHNASSASPAPASLTGRATGLDATTAMSGFSGRTTIALIDSAGVIQNRVAIDFSAGTMSLNGGAATGFTPASFVATLNATLGGLGSASFTGGALSLSATSGGIAVVDDAASPSAKASQGFSQFFGLNDIVKSTAYPADTGLATTDPHGFAAGQQITLRLSEPGGARLRDVAVSVPAGGTMADLIASLNAPNTGVSPYGAFGLDANGRLAFSSATNPAASLSVVSDQTTRGAGGPSLSTFFGIGTANLAKAAAGYSVDPAIYQNPSKLALGLVNLSAAAGASALAPGDGRGASALAKAGESVTRFGAAGGLPATSMTLSRYASEMAGSLGRRAATAEAAATSAEAVRTEAENRRTSYEGVNTDEELVLLTTYQQAFNASARLIQAANELYDTLLKMV